MAELVDAPASGAGAGNGVEVRVLFRAPYIACKQQINNNIFTYRKIPSPQLSTLQLPQSHPVQTQ
jgi:hypothetical protein